MMFGEEFGKHMTPLFKDEPNTEETRQRIQDYLEKSLQAVDGGAGNVVDHEGKRIRLASTIEELQFIIPTLAEGVRYEVEFHGEHVGHVTYNGAESLGTKLTYNYTLEPAQPVEYVKVSMKLD